MTDPQGGPGPGQGDPAGFYRVGRGGDWSNGAGNCRSGSRSGSSRGSDRMGFRVVLAPTTNP